MGVKNVKVKAMKLDEVLCFWFRQQREKGVPVTGVLLQVKAKLFYQQLYLDATTPFAQVWGFEHNL